MQTPQSAGGSDFVPGELDAVGEAEVEEGGEFDPADLEDEKGGQWGAMVEESAGGWELGCCWLVGGGWRGRRVGG